jgi:hypothetical protein
MTRLSGRRFREKTVPSKVKENTKRDIRRLERSDTVLWSLSPMGIVLHNFALRKFIELDQTGYRLWSLLDGSRCVDDVVSMCRQSREDSPYRAPSERKIRDIVTLLSAYGFIVKRP